MREKAAKLVAVAYIRGVESPYELPEIKAAMKGNFIAVEAPNRGWYVAEVNAAKSY